MENSREDRLRVPTESRGAGWRVTAQADGDGLGRTIPGTGYSDHSSCRTSLGPEGAPEVSSSRGWLSSSPRPGLNIVASLLGDELW